MKRHQVQHTLTERRIVQHVNHPFIVSLRYAFETTGHLCMVFDFYSGGELFHYLTQHIRLPLSQVVFYAAEMVLALEYLHNQQIVYRDLKPENILLDATGHIGLTDFGLSRQYVRGNTINSFVGTSEYLAPEIICKCKYGKAVDFWALGVIIYEMLASSPPFYDANKVRMFKRILDDEVDFSRSSSTMTASTKSLISELLRKRPSERLGSAGIFEIKQHPFFETIDWDLLAQKKIVPPFVPPQVSELNQTRNFDTSITAIPLSQVLTSPVSCTAHEFTDFNFAPAS